MAFVATLIAGHEQRIDEAAVQQVLKVIAKLDGRTEKTAWLSHDEACDVFFDGDYEKIKESLSHYAQEQYVDIITQHATGRKKKALLADMESTIIKQEMLEELADFVGLRDKVEEITTRAMNGELDFKAALKERLALLKGLSASVVDALCEKIIINPGAADVVRTMRAQGARCIIVSGGFKAFTAYVATQLGFDEEHGNILDITDGQITGAMVEPVLDKHSKLATLKATAQKMQIPEQDICAVGDGANDLPMLMAAGLGVAYHAKPLVQQQASHNLRHANLRGLLWAQGYRREEIRMS